MWTANAAKVHYRALAQEEAELVLTARKAWRNVSSKYPVESWRQVVDQQFMPLLAQSQSRVALLSSSYSASVLADQDFWVAPNGFVDPDGLAGIAAKGGNLRGQLLEPAYRTDRLIAGGMAPSKAMSQAENALFFQLVSTLADTSRAAAGMDVALRDGVGYVRVVHGSACGRCIILAGRFYRWNQGFERHPNCRCEHEATTKPRSEGMFDDPYKAFENMTPEQQAKAWGIDNAKAIREGADIYQVTNARRGMTKTRMFTTEGMTKRGNALQGLKRGQRRLTPEAIYKQAGNNRVKARELLTEHGYILPRGQVPGGSLRGRVEGFGQMGKGGKAKAAREAIEEARLTGVRDPNNRYTMTAAERRMYDAEQDYKMVLQGRNPYASGGFGNTPDPYRLRLNNIGGSTAPLTPQIAAQVEKNYRRWLVTNGEVYKTTRTAKQTITTTNAVKPKPLTSGASGGSKIPPTKSLASGFPDPEQWQAIGKGQLRVPKAAEAAPHEVETGRKLANAGHKVEFREIIHGTGIKNPDVIMDGKVWEIKSPKGASEKNTISDQFKRARKQSERLVIDLQRCGLSDDIARSQIERRFFGQIRIKELIIIDKNGLMTYLK